MFAYVDPGLGLLAWQAALAALVGVMCYLKKTRMVLARLILKPFSLSQPTPRPISPVPANEAKQCP
jgi:hypothetical protein